MFDARIRAENLREIVEVLSTLVDEVKVSINKDEISTKAVDPAHVAMVDLVVSKKAFEKFKGDEMELGLHLDKLKSILKLTRSGDEISMHYDEDKNRLIVQVGNITRTMALVDTAGMSEPKVPKLSLPSSMTVKVSELVQGIRAAESISDHIALHMTPEGFQMNSEGETDSTSLKIPKESLEELKTKESVRSLFPLDYFTNMVKAASSADTVSMWLGTDFPVKIEFSLAGGHGHVRYLLAPRIETE
ncbi:MAG TPA: proliferating cell nuclear antigen (pcna) [Euryarchaeota archaeon]|mgnify:CR=1 FL=1|nr:proliferating cell nuclear antigen (pcna) [Euryarchaeota archaeon]